MSLRADFAANLKRLREGKGLTQSDIGDQQYVSSIERGKRLPSFAKIEELASTLRVEPSALFGAAPVPADAATRYLKSEIEHLLKQNETMRRALTEIRKEVRSTVVRRRIDNTLKETEG